MEKSPDMRGLWVALSAYGQADPLATTVVATLIALTALRILRGNAGRL